MKTIFLVTGAAGHLGNAIVKKLIEQGQAVRALVYEEDETNGIFDPQVEVFVGDVTDEQSLRPFFDVPESGSVKVIHCAGIISIASRTQKRMHETNVEGTKNIIALCQEYAVDKLVYVSSVHAIPELPHGEMIIETKSINPDLVVGPYAKTKAEATVAVLKAAEARLDASVVHPTGIMGPFDYGAGHVNQMLRDFYAGRLFAGVRGGYDFVDVRDVAQGTINATTLGRKGETYLLSNRYFTVAELLELFHQVTGRPRVKTMLPLWFAKLTAPLSELYYKILKRPPLYTSYSLYTLSTNAEFSNLKAKRELNYTTRNMEETIADTIRWFKEQGM